MLNHCPVRRLDLYYLPRLPPARPSPGSHSLCPCPMPSIRCLYYRTCRSATSQRRHRPYEARRRRRQRLPRRPSPQVLPPNMADHRLCPRYQRNALPARNDLDSIHTHSPSADRHNLRKSTFPTIEFLLWAFHTLSIMFRQHVPSKCPSNI